MIRVEKHKIAVAALLVAWLVGSGVTLFWLQNRELALFDPSIMSSAEPFPIDAVASRLRSDSGVGEQPLLVHAWDPDCGCSELATQHLQQLAPALREQGVSVAVISPRELTERERSGFRQRSGLDPVTWMVDASRAVPSSPAAVLIAASGEPVYLGPYAAGAACVASAGGFVESALLNMSGPALVNRAVSGCYCEWQPKQILSV